MNDNVLYVLGCIGVTIIGSLAVVALWSIVNALVTEIWHD